MALRGGRRRSQLEARLRELVRDGTLGAGARLPSSRALADDLGVSRRLVVDAYAQLVAEGYFAARQGAGTFVAAGAARSEAVSPAVEAAPARFDFFPGSPDLEGFPRALWLRTLREVLRETPARALAYPDVRGAVALRNALCEHLRRVRGLLSTPESMIVCSGATHGLALLARALSRQGVERIAVEDPSLPPHRALLAYAGVEVVPVPVDGEGLSVDALARSGARVVLVTPAHQFPTGVALSPARRSELLAWAGGGGMVIEDDYDAEFRYDGLPLGALQGMAPERVVYVGTASKTLAPSLRLGWLALPASLLPSVLEAKLADDLGCPTLEQLTLARLLESAAYDRELRRARRRNRARRDALLSALRRHVGGAEATGIAAGLHVVVRLPAPLAAQDLWQAAAARSLAVYPLSFHFAAPACETDALVMGYASLSEATIEEGVRVLASVLREQYAGADAGAGGQRRAIAGELQVGMDEERR
ncbi:MAG: MocR-like pyridoxine biosynthesis transcription factor PdxR [Solirubrobacteraceae bacterium]